MKYTTMTDILFTLLAKRRVSASEFAAKYGCSVRTVYRYVEELSLSGVPITVARGANGGIFISDAYKLPKGFMTREEYKRALDAMQAMLSETGDAVLDSAIQKISAQMKSERIDESVTGNILVDSGTWGDERRLSEKLSFLERATENREAVAIDYISRLGERTQRTVLPHLLVYKQRVWYLYAYCNLRQEFRLFKVGRMRSIVGTGTTFTRIPFSRSDVPLTFWQSEEFVDAVFSVSEETLPFAEEWLGIDSISEEEGRLVAHATLPDDDILVGTILSAGAGFEVLSPPDLRERVKRTAERIAARYENA